MADRNLEHPLKVLIPMIMTLLGMVIDVRALHPSKALSPMDVILLGMVIDVRALHPLKVSTPNGCDTVGDGD